MPKEFLDSNFCYWQKYQSQYMCPNKNKWKKKTKQKSKQITKQNKTKQTNKQTNKQTKNKNKNIVELKVTGIV